LDLKWPRTLLEEVHCEAVFCLSNNKIIVQLKSSSQRKLLLLDVSAAVIFRKKTTTHKPWRDPGAVVRSCFQFETLRAVLHGTCIFSRRMLSVLFRWLVFKNVETKGIFTVCSYYSKYHVIIFFFFPIS